jgi:ribonucleoside-diphosphate reductase alpha chain
MAKLMVVKRNGEVADFDVIRIKEAIQKASQASGVGVPQKMFNEIMDSISIEVENRFIDLYPNVENIQDIVEKNLMRNALYDIAKAYILYRAKRQEAREVERKENIEKSILGKLTVIKRDGKKTLFNINKVKSSIRRSAKGYEKDISVDLLCKEIIKNIYDGISTNKISKALVLASISHIEKDPAYDSLSARLYLQEVYKEVIGPNVSDDIMGLSYREAFIRNIREGVKEEFLDETLLDFDLEKLSYALKIERDSYFGYLGIQTLYDRYFVSINDRRIESPQAFWMRVAMGLSVNEKNRTERAIEFYEVMSSLRYVSSTPTLFNSGTRHPQLSSCYLTTVSDNLKHIFKCISDNAQLSKWSGGIGNDWTNVRATGSYIKGTNGKSQGVIPFLKIVNDTAVAVNQGGKRKGVTCSYLETWHLDIEEFLDLRKNTGDERRRTHDMNTANWIPDLFMKRVLSDENWTLFSPNEVPELHHLYGKEFERKYTEYERKAENGEIKRHKVISASKMWRKMLSMLFETGHPWITFKDPCNIRSPQDHCGVIHNSNLCTEITLNTSEDETAVCNLGSVNLGRHIKEGGIDEVLISKTIRTAIRMLDNVIDINFYPVIEAKNANSRHRPVGLGVMGFQDALFKLGVPFDSPGAIKFSDQSMEIVSYHAILSSSELAKERGTYQSYRGSKWDRGIFPVDTIDLLEQDRGFKVEVSRESSKDWSSVREHVKLHGMRNSNTLAIAPTATIANIVGCYPCIEPIYKNIYVKANMGGEFTVVNKYLVEDLKKNSLWNNETLEQLKYYDGNLQMIPSIPDDVKELYKEAFEINAEHCIKMSAERGKWIDQSQSHNVFMKGLSGKKLSDVYIKAWKMGLKTTYYLRSLAASQIEKSTLDASKYGFTQKRAYKESVQTSTQNNINVQSLPQPPALTKVAAIPSAPQSPEIELEISGNQQVASQVKNVCSLFDPDCEACQ